MCITKILPGPVEPTGRGWKVMSSRMSDVLGRRLYNTVYNGAFKNHEEGVWYDAKIVLVFVSDGQQRNVFGYDSGYHVFTALTDAHKYRSEMQSMKPRSDAWVVVPVEYRGAHTAGIESRCEHPVVVASHMRIIPEEEREDIAMV